jgi:hypothetical protein
MKSILRNPFNSVGVAGIQLPTNGLELLAKMELRKNFI